jgi:uncharacterized MAPEG superfamily protein
MTPELTALALAGLLQAALYFAYTIAGQRQVGSRAALGKRDAPLELTGKTARIQRTLNNQLEGLILFTLAVVVVTMSAQSTALTAACAYTFVAARVLYVFCYVYGLTPWRSYVWLVSIVASVTMIVAALLP